MSPLARLTGHDLEAWRQPASVRLVDRLRAGRSLSEPAALAGAQDVLAAEPVVLVGDGGSLWMRSGEVIELVAPGRETEVLREAVARASGRLAVTALPAETGLRLAAGELDFADVSSRMRLDLAAPRNGARPLGLTVATPAEVAAFAERHVREYTESQTRASAVDVAATAREAAAETARTLTMPGTALYLARDDGGTEVGELWLETSDRRAYVLQVTVLPAARGRGLGRALMVAAEDLVGDAGHASLALSVFSWNQVARRLYDSLGYVETERTYALALP